MVTQFYDIQKLMLSNGTTHGRKISIDRAIKTFLNRKIGLKSGCNARVLDIAPSFTIIYHSFLH